MTHDDGIALDESSLKNFPNRTEHDPSNLAEARSLADRQDVYPIGLFYRDTGAFRYDEATSRGLAMTRTEKLTAIEKSLDRFAV